MKVLVLEDSEERITWFRSKFPSAEIVNTADEAIRLLSEAPYDVIFLDHDLAPLHYEGYNPINDESSGRKVTRWIIATDTQKSARFVVHSLNAPGAAAMVETLHLSGRRVEWVPFTVLLQLEFGPLGI